MSELRGNLRGEFHDKEYRHAYADESLNTYIATQIKVLREQQQLTQKELAELTGMAQPRIAVLEDINYSSWSINTLRRLAEAFDLRLSVRFETFSSLIPEIETFRRESLERAKFEDDSWFHKKDVQLAEVPILNADYENAEQQFATPKRAKILSMDTRGIGGNYNPIVGGAAVAAVGGR